MLSSDMTGDQWKGSDTDKIHFPTGATRSKSVAGAGSKPVRYDLISPHSMRRLAEVFAEGAAKHGARNWERGLDRDDTINRLLGHLMEYMNGNTEEDHLGHALWNVAALTHFDEVGWKGGKDADDSARVITGGAPLHSHSCSLRPLDRSRIETVPHPGLGSPK